MRFSVLGTLEVRSADHRLVRLGAAKQRTLLAVLLLNVNRPVPVDRLVEALWQQRPPRTAAVALRTYVSALRRALGHADRAEPSPLCTVPGGYQIRLRPAELDLLAFEELAAQGRQALADGRPGLAGERLRRALGLWRGRPFEDVALDPLPGAELVRLEERRLAAQETWIDSQLALGHHRDLLAELGALVVEQPLRERLQAQWMIALYRSGRQAEAMRAYRDLRLRLVRELGVEPSPPLQRLHRQILAGHADLALPPGTSGAPPGTASAVASGTAPATAPAASVAAPGVPAPPRQLPRDIASFTGRAAELSRLMALARPGEPVLERPPDRPDDPVQDAPADRPAPVPPGPVPPDPVPPGPVTSGPVPPGPDSSDPATPVIGAVHGMAGVGKTTLAVHAAHLLAGRFTDGQLFVDLHGFTQGVSPVDPADALDQMLRSLGVPGEQIPVGLDARAALYRSRLAGRRVLILLDNAGGEAQVRPLLPGAPGCLTLITSRRRLAGLDDVRPLCLDVLSPGDALTLFTRTAGARRVTAQPPGLLTEIVELCGRLPLAIRIAAARLRTRSGWTPADLADRLRDHQNRLGELEVGQLSITATMDLSYHHLSPGRQGMYRLLGLHPGPDIEPHAAAALAGTTLKHAGHLLDDLVDAHLLQEPLPGRYRFHDLVRTHATATVADEDTEADRHTALTRLFDHYIRAASAAADHADVPGGGPAGRPGNPATRAGAPGWPDTEPPGRAAECFERALEIARMTGDRDGELRALCGLGRIHCRGGRHDQAAEHFEQALKIADATGGHDGELCALIGLGVVHLMRGEHRQAADRYRRALRLARRIGDRDARFEGLHGLGRAHQAAGHPDRALTCHRAALALARDLGRPAAQVRALHGLAGAHRDLGRHDEAREQWRRALDILTGLGDPAPGTAHPSPRGPDRSP
ncbi:BTAD domain-containing putative transcriptional regulator [Streptosporangium sp. NPDC023615]|uniref:AfsR/SARP family transcriptional regulator n=1 Tax=Streptosporangium sp. NPDC023615 TaxID=3154794 RepID=UPI0034436D69